MKRWRDLLTALGRIIQVALTDMMRIGELLQLLGLILEEHIQTAAQIAVPLKVFTSMESPISGGVAILVLMEPAF